MKILESIWRFFVPRERTLIFTSFKVEDYTRVKIRLSASGIRHRSRIANWNAAQSGGPPTRSSQYSIYVAKEDEDLALQAARSR